MVMAIAENDITKDIREFDVRIVSVTLDTQCAKNGGGTYPGCEVIYKTADQQVQTKNMHNNTFKFNKELRNQLSVLVAGDYAHIVVKKEGDFANWVSAKKVDAPAKAPEQPTAAAQRTGNATAAPAPTQAAVRSNYETPEERAARQRFIVRQSCLDYAIKFYGFDKSYIPSDQDIMAQAEVFVNFVFETQSEDTLGGNTYPVGGCQGDPDKPQDDGNWNMPD
jgi:hypothetical protein